VSVHGRHGPVVVLIRHGETEWSASGRHTSVTDVRLTDGGRAAAERIGRRLAGYDFGLVLVSPRVRAQETARLAGLAARAETEPDLVEWDYGEFEGLTTPEIREEHPGWSVWTDPSPGGETAEQVGARADRVIARVADAGVDVALVAHGHLLRVLAARWIGLDARGGASLGLDTAALCELGHEREHPAIWLWNDTSHVGS
jgi:probable phosphoglycerate mutase